MPIDLQYLRYCQPGNPFYSPPNASDEARGFDVDSRKAEGWQTKMTPPWVNWFPDGWVFPRQGWKIHVSATPSNAELVLSKTAEYCFQSCLPFKHLVNLDALLMQNGKYADRAGAGKFITIYPNSDEQFTVALNELDSLK